MNKSKLFFCAECRRDVEFIIEELAVKSSLKGEEYEYIGKKAICKECGKEIYVPEINDFNLKALYDSYRLKNDLISLEKILEIPQKYNIGKRPFSILLGWGEMTFTRYCDGYLPTKQYSDILKEIYDSPVKYLQILEQNKNKLNSNLPYEKSKKSTEKLISRRKAYSKIDVAIDYLLCQCEDITPLALQKLLYYIQGFYFAFMDDFIFKEDCQAWVHGPVYREIYFRYNHYQFDPIKLNEICDKSQLTEKERAVVDSVIKNLGCYSGKLLEKFTHSETPWIKTRNDLSVNEPSDKIISKDIIGEYFKNAKAVYNMLSPVDIQYYAKNLFEKLN